MKFIIALGSLALIKRKVKREEEAIKRSSKS